MTNQYKIELSELLNRNVGDSVFTFKDSPYEPVEAQIVNFDAETGDVELKLIESGKTYTIPRRKIERGSKMKTPHVHYYNSAKDAERALFEFNKGRQQAYVDEYKDDPELFFVEMVGQAIRFEQMTEFGDEYIALGIIEVAKMHLSKSQLKDLKHIYNIH